MRLVARDYRTSAWIELRVRGESLQAITPIKGPEQVEPEDLWVAPGFWDLQVNGLAGHSFSGSDITIDQVTAIVRDQGALGTARLCPTLITAPVDHMLHGLRTIAAACEQFPDVARRVAGIHIEGPFLSEIDGYRGAHPAESICDPSWSLFEEFQRASGGRVVLMTLAPERQGAIDFIRRATAAGCVIALGHTAAPAAVIHEAVRAGARLSTHLGNGIAQLLPRHPNPIWEQAAIGSLWASFIADGHHLDASTLRVLARAKGPEHTILVSDASPLAGLPPGRYGAWEIEPSGRIVVAGTPYLAGSNHGLETGLTNLLAATGWTLEQALATVATNPAQLLGRPAPRLRGGEPADFVLFHWANARLSLAKHTR
jgi:N-acetylglucosamine-6-phosphate deacetylase